MSGNKAKKKIIAIYLRDKGYAVVWCDQGKLKKEKLTDDLLRRLWNMETDEKCKDFPNGSYAPDGKDVYEKYGGWFILATFYRGKYYVFTYLSPEYIYESESFFTVDDAIGSFKKKLDIERLEMEEI